MSLASSNMTPFRIAYRTDVKGRHFAFGVVESGVLGFPANSCDSVKCATSSSCQYDICEAITFIGLKSSTLLSSR